MYKCKQSCAYQSEDQGTVSFVSGKTYTKEEIACVPKCDLIGEQSHFIQIAEAEVVETEVKAKGKGKGKKADTEDEDERV